MFCDFQWQQLCFFLIENHEEDLESSLIMERQDVEQHICFALSKACEDIYHDSKRKLPDHADIDLTSGKRSSMKDGSYDSKYVSNKGTPLPFEFFEYRFLPFLLFPTIS